MAAHYSKRLGAWVASVQDGPRRIRRQFQDQEAAQAWELEAKAAALRGREVPTLNDDGGLSLRELVTATYKTRWAKNKTGKRTLRDLESLVELLGGWDLPVNILEDPVTSESLVAKLEARGNAGATINFKLVLWNQLCQVAYSAGAIQALPEAPEKHEEAEPVERYLSVEEADGLLRAAGPGQLQDMLVLLLDTGMHLGELYDLKPADILKGKVALRGSESSKAREIPLTKRAASAALRLAHRKPIPRATFRRHFDAARNDAGLGEDVVPNTLRHTCASRLVERGVDLCAVSQWLGHSSVRGVQRYAYLAPDPFQAALAALEAMNPEDLGSSEGGDRYGAASRPRPHG